MNLAIPADHKLKIKENEKKRQILRSCERTKKHEGDSDTSCNWCTWNDPQRLSKRVGGVGNQRKSQNHPNYSIVEVSQDTENSPGDLRRFAITQTPVKDHHLTLRWKTCKRNLRYSSDMYVVDWLVGWLFCFTAYQPFSGHLTQNLK